MQVTGPVFPKRVDLGLRCLYFGTGRVTMATWGHIICPFPTLGTGAMGMIHMFGDHMTHWV